MTALHDWEQVFARPTNSDGVSSYMNRYRVPGGWIYVHGIVQKYWFRKPDVHVTSAFVPDPTAD